MCDHPVEDHITYAVICESCTNTDFISTHWYCGSDVKGNCFYKDCAWADAICTLRRRLASTYTYCHEKVCFNLGEINCYGFKYFLFKDY